MDLVGVTSPEPGPAAAWGASKVRNGLGKCTYRGHLGWFCRRARRGWQMPRLSGRRLGKFWTKTPGTPGRGDGRQGRRGGGKRGGECGAGGGPRLPETWGLSLGRPPCCLKLRSVFVGGTRSETMTFAGKLAPACFGRAKWVSPITQEAGRRQLLASLDKSGYPVQAISCFSSSER